jgi:hypothetical protein
MGTPIVAIYAFPKYIQSFPDPKTEFFILGPMGTNPLSATPPKPVN